MNQARLVLGAVIVTACLSLHIGACINGGNYLPLISIIFLLVGGMPIALAAKADESNPLSDWLYFIGMALLTSSVAFPLVLAQSHSGISWTSGWLSAAGNFSLIALTLVAMLCMNRDAGY